MNERTNLKQLRDAVQAQATASGAWTESWLDVVRVYDSGLRWALKEAYAQGVKDGMSAAVRVDRDDDGAAAGGQA